jgi:hypothetical protein
MRVFMILRFLTSVFDLSNSDLQSHGVAVCMSAF